MICMIHFKIFIYETFSFLTRERYMPMYMHLNVFLAHLNPLHAGSVSLSQLR